MEKGDHRDPFGGGPLCPPIGQWQMPGTHRRPRSLIVTSAAAALDQLQLQALGDVSGLLSSIVCGRLEPRKPGEAPFLVPQPQASTVRLYLMPRSISERAWVLCVCLSSDRRRPPREGPSPQLPPCSHSRPNAAWRGRLIRKQAEGLLAPSTRSGSPLPHEPA